MGESFASVDAYVASRPVEVQVILEELRRLVALLAEQRQAKPS